MKDIIQDTLKGFSSNVFAYGQTGAGKTFSMSGDEKMLGQRGESIWCYVNNLMW